ncbi:unnamed protein product [Staurois parvus]|uniref:Uncharacterized protein n=1 Tax=Staurois parvus TaxID=386267 RepID=A0ABN9DSU6_9NEOB|nr:unnamed protein product [Staurois parvus]
MMATDWHHCWALTGGTDWHNRWALTGSTAGLHWWVGTGGWHWWAQVGGTGGHRCVTLQRGTGGCTAGHRWAHCWAQVGGTCGWHCWAPIISALMIGADPRSDNCRFSARVIGHR